MLFRSPGGGAPWHAPVPFAVRRKKRGSKTAEPQSGERLLREFSTAFSLGAAHSAGVLRRTRPPRVRFHGKLPAESRPPAKKGALVPKTVWDESACALRGATQIQGRTDLSLKHPIRMIEIF